MQLSESSKLHPRQTLCQPEKAAPLNSTLPIKSSQVRFGAQRSKTKQHKSFWQEMGAALVKIWELLTTPFRWLQSFFKSVDIPTQPRVGKSLNEDWPIGPLTTEQVFGSNPITFQQNGGNTCYLLAALDGILQHPKRNQILDQIGFEKTREGYIVRFPGQPDPIHVSHDDFRYNGVESDNPGIRLLEAAYFKIPENRGRWGEFDESANALRRIFGEEVLSTISIQNSKNISHAIIEGDYEWLNAGHELEPGKSFESDDRSILVTKDLDNTLTIIPNEHCTVTLPGKKGEPTIYESQDRNLFLRVYRAENGTNTAIYRRKPHEGEHHIGSLSIAHTDRATHFKQLIEQAKDSPNLDVLTAIRIGRPETVSIRHKGQDFTYQAPQGRHYYSLRLHESTPDEIVLVDPFNTSKPFHVPFDKFMQEYNIEGMRLRLRH